jgi:hypothetical protein
MVLLHRRHVTALFVICWELDAEALDRSHLQGVDPVEVFDRCGDGNGLGFSRLADGELSPVPSIARELTSRLL